MGSQNQQMEDDYRALLTDREREILSGDADVSDSYRYRVVSRVRKKIERLEKDAELLEQHRPDLLNEVRDSICGQVPEE